MDNYNFLVVRPDRIGDVVLSTPIPRAIKKHNPEYFVSILVRDYTRDIYLNNPYVDEIISLDEYKNNFSGNIKLISKLRNLNLSHSFMLLPKERINWILFVAGIKHRIGVGHKFYQFITNTKSVYRRKYKELKSEADYCLEHLRKIGIQSNDLSTEIFLTNDEKIKSIKIKNELCPNGELLVGIHTTNGNSAPNLSISEYKKLITLLTQNKKIKIVITDNKIPDGLEEVEINFVNLNNRLRETIINIAALDYFISSSTGPMHIAAALKVKTISMFCPLIACSPKLWGPQGNDAIIILPAHNYCRNICSGNPKQCDFSGENGINAEIVYQKFLSTIEKNKE